MSNFADCMSKLAILIIEMCLAGAIGSAFFMKGNAQMAVGICGIVIFLLFNMCLCCFWKQVKVAIAVIDATADFFAATKRIILVSVFYFFVTLVFLVLWFAAVGCIMSLNTITSSSTEVQGKDIVWDHNVFYFLGFMVVGLIWVVFWIQDKTGFICMVSASTYYFSSNKDKEGSASVSTGFKFAYFKHAGSLAFGSAIHTFVTILRILVEQAADNVERGGNNAAVMVLACCARCMVRCFENLVEYLNRIAYAYMAVSGDSYCTSAWNGFLLNLKHNAKFSFGNLLASMFIFMGKVMITCANCATCYIIIKYINKNEGALSSIWAPVGLIGVSTFITATIFLGLFDEATLATLHCLAIDMDLNQGKPVYGPPTFHEKISRIYGPETKVVQYQQVHTEQQAYIAPSAGNINSGPNNMV